VEHHSELQSVRDFFLSSDEKTDISVEVASWETLDYAWLFDQFATKIRENIKRPDYVNLMQSDFSTSTPSQVISSQVMMMSSLQHFFSFHFGTACGIPAVELRGSRQDWVRLGQKTKQLEALLAPVLTDLQLETWFTQTRATQDKLLDTFDGKPDTEWWSHILSWNRTYGSGGRTWWSGWMVDFLRAEQKADKPADFPSGTCSTPVTIRRAAAAGVVEEGGLLVAGTVGWTLSGTE